jgi:hypothetical protein
MKWLEIIELNYGESKPKLMENDLEALAKKLNKEKAQQVINVYSRVSEEIDFCIHLHHKSDNIEKNGSLLGITLSTVLKEFGMIQHKVWV